MLFLQRRGVYFVANRLQMYVETAFWQINMGVLRVKICNFVPDFFSHHPSNMLFNSIEFANFIISSQIKEKMVTIKTAAFNIIK